MALTKVNSILVDGAINTDASGNVGIGTSSPNGKLNVNGGGGNSKLKLSNTVSGNGNGDGFDIDFTGTDVYITNRESGFMAFENNGSERMRLDTSGRVQINTTTPLFDTCILSATHVLNGAGFVHTGTTSNAYSPIIVRRTGSIGSFIDFVNQSGSAGIGSISTSNNTSVAYNTSSDYRLKENIVPMTGALATVSALKPVTYTWKSDKSQGQGFIAHELSEVVPDCVTGEKDAVETYVDEDGAEQTRPKYQGIDVSFLVATLTAAIQEQQEIITDLKSRIETLEAK